MRSCNSRQQQHEDYSLKTEQQQQQQQQPSNSNNNNNHNNNINHNNINNNINTNSSNSVATSLHCAAQNETTSFIDDLESSVEIIIQPEVFQTQNKNRKLSVPLPAADTDWPVMVDYEAMPSYQRYQSTPDYLALSSIKYFGSESTEIGNANATNKFATVAASVAATTTAFAATTTTAAATTISVNVVNNKRGISNFDEDEDLLNNYQKHVSDDDRRADAQQGCMEYSSADESNSSQLFETATDFAISAVLTDMELLEDKLAVLNNDVHLINGEVEYLQKREDPRKAVARRYTLGTTEALTDRKRKWARQKYVRRSLNGVQTYHRLKNERNNATRSKNVVDNAINMEEDNDADNDDDDDDDDGGGGGAGDERELSDVVRRLAESADFMWDYRTDFHYIPRKSLSKKMDANQKDDSVFGDGADTSSSSLQSLSCDINGEKAPKRDKNSVVCSTVAVTPVRHQHFSDDETVKKKNWKRMRCESKQWASNTNLNEKPFKCKSESHHAPGKKKLNITDDIYIDDDIISPGCDVIKSEVDGIENQMTNAGMRCDKAVKKSRGSTASPAFTYDQCPSSNCNPPARKAILVKNETSNSQTKIISNLSSQRQPNNFRAELFSLPDSVESNKNVKSFDQYLLERCQFVTTADDEIIKDTFRHIEKITGKSSVCSLKRDLYCIMRESFHQALLSDKLLQFKKCLPNYFTTYKDLSERAEYSFLKHWSWTSLAHLQSHPDVSSVESCLRFLTNMLNAYNEFSLRNNDINNNNINNNNISTCNNNTNNSISTSNNNINNNNISTCNDNTSNNISTCNNNINILTCNNNINNNNNFDGTKTSLPLPTNPTIDGLLMETIKMLMMVEACRLYQDFVSGPSKCHSLAWQLFLKGATSNPEKLLRNRISNIGKTVAMNKAEISLLAYTLKLKLEIFNTSASSGAKNIFSSDTNFVSYFPDTGADQFEKVQLIEESENCYISLLMQP
ncbi:hypothetical protein HELRODRAFT_190648 [Helobdella robusta]|uniref:Uncharacterized protein n=1 Tax=Helobdella robusta TaxID=6412 RepID=T1FS61_HELRO|nr:hypothetical protein HELRODRAFT_190648 [Helobdella robusta]ESO08872.1 hypothetical protein HELRODRAFT_190648 [Helobdella robusta]